MITNFSEQVLRITNDANLAVFIENIASWIRFNASKAEPSQRNFHEGRYWTYSSYPELVKYFGGIWSIQTIRTMVNKCIKLGLLISSNFNKKKYDNTNWYSLTDKALEFYPVLAGMILYTPVEINRPPVEINRPIPENHNSLSSNINITTSEFHNSRAASSREIDKSDYSSNQVIDEFETDIDKNSSGFDDKSDYQNNHTKKDTLLPKYDQISRSRKINTGGKTQSSQQLMPYIDVYRKVFPNNPQPHKRVVATSLQKTLQALIKRWPELDPQGRGLTLETFTRYLEMLKDKAPKFSLGEYTTPNGRKKKNGLETFVRWDTVVKFLEDYYS